jgi:Ca2+-binding EF-hand superfamily protein
MILLIYGIYRLINFNKQQIDSLIQVIQNSEDRYTLKQSTLVKSLNFSEKAAQNVSKNPSLTSSQVINRFDHGSHGYIDSNEFLCAVILLADLPFDQKVQTLFDLYDVDKSTMLTLDETMVLMSNAQNALALLDGKPLPSMQ